MLIGRGANQETALLLSQVGGGIVVDEYRHFFSDRTLQDLLLLPSFSLPLGALVAGALAFFLFGYSTPPARISQSRVTSSDTVYHAFSADVLRGLIERSGGRASAFERMQYYFLRRFPNHRDQIARDWRRIQDQELPELAQFRELISLHQRLLLSRRTPYE